MRSVCASLAIVGIVLGTQAQAQNTKFDSAAMAFGRFVEIPQHMKLIAVMSDVDGKPAPFVTDGCSGGMSATWAPAARILPGMAEQYQKAPPWETCCITHDRAYHNSQNAMTADESFDARFAADEVLRQCVLKDGEDRRDDIAAEFSTSAETVDTAYSVIANGMFSAVRVGGVPCSGLPWRWGYGFPTCFWK